MPSQSTPSKSSARISGVTCSFRLSARSYMSSGRRSIGILDHALAVRERLAALEHHDQGRGRAMSPPPFPSEYRASGVLLHVTSLPSRYGVGDFGPGAVAWIDCLRDAGQRWCQALPLGPTGYGDSPYQALSSFAGNGLLISLDWLIEDGLLQASDCEGHAFSATAVDYGPVIDFKQRLLETVRERLNAGNRPDLKIGLVQFC